MKKIHFIPFHFLLLGVLYLGAETKSFVSYPESINSYLKRIQQGEQSHAFDETENFANWQRKARGALVKITGLKRMQTQLAGFKPKVIMGEEDRAPKDFTRSLCSIETEPGVKVPFYLLVPKSATSKKPLPLALC
ncbi:MAG: hypothetical protein OSB39_05185, partial [Opitutales bacterium]|nr:hypothetical protein [Opitutales bacterium]